MTADLIAILLGAAAGPSPYPGFEPLKAPREGAALCTADARICIASPEPGVLSVTRDAREIARWSPDTEGDDLSVQPMPALIRLQAGGLLIGALATRQTGYSGGGGSAAARPGRAGQGDRAGTDRAGERQPDDPRLLQRKGRQASRRRMP